MEPESEFVIKIHDINDNEPTFPEEIYTASVPEMSVVGECFILQQNACSNYVIQEIFSPSSENSLISGDLYGNKYCSGLLALTNTRISSRKRYCDFY